MRAMKARSGLMLFPLLVLASFGAFGPIGGYKARPWTVRERENYPASLTSEGVTIAVEPLYTNALAARAFDKEDMVTRGIMPLAIYIFNDNDFAIDVDGLSVEVIHKEDHIRTIYPYEAVYRLFSKSKEWIRQPIPRIASSRLNENALEDFERKFLIDRTVNAHASGSGFLYLHIPNAADLATYLLESSVYIPKIYRHDDGSRLIYFEIELSAAFKTAVTP